MYIIQDFLKHELTVLECSPQKWAVEMMKEETELDTLTLTAIRNMLGVSEDISKCAIRTAVITNVSYNFNLHLILTRFKRP